MLWITGKRLATATPWSLNLSGYASSTLHLFLGLLTQHRQVPLCMKRVWQLIGEPVLSHSAAVIGCHSVGTLVLGVLCLQARLHRALQLSLQPLQVWDYASDGYVHRLVQSKTDGKLVEVPSPAQAAHGERLSTACPEYVPHFNTSRLHMCPSKACCLKFLQAVGVCQAAAIHLVSCQPEF